MTKGNYFALALGVSLILWAVIGSAVIAFAGGALEPGGAALVRLAVGLSLLLAGAALRGWAFSRIDRRVVRADLVAAWLVMACGFGLALFAAVQIVSIQQGSQ